MNQFIKSNKLWLSLLGLAVVIVIMAFILRPKTMDFNTSADQAIKLMNDPQMQVTVQELTGRQLIDLRSEELFLQGHAENAINIPVRNLLEEESLELFDQLKQSGQEVVLYASNELEATGPCILLRQMGYPNLKTLKGGFSLNNKFIESGLSNTEMMLLDTAAMKTKPEIKASQPEKKKPQMVIPVRQEISAGGGC